MPLCFCSSLFTSLFNNDYITDFNQPTIPQSISLFITIFETCTFHEWIITRRNIIYLYKKYIAVVKP
ncbi:hypothetical protein CN543_02895 [Bacillus toyonensis]|nr:hypothetical protein CON61_26930 [Bacillus toyonensis]PED19168.1 hypothetical protein CON63_17165 [Bacillus toyonensis]PEM96061.1 hypothetical protein CN629_09785 [Bacillus toyonensis]PEN40092.1 hypothetical protein CN543_02895 [Bacillus toyonensis]PEO06817.1 hypothetical protein CN561_03960 [Bacillus toyonensis]